MENTLSSHLKHKEHIEWLNKLDFYQDEIKFFQNELRTVFFKHPDLHSITDHVEEYQQLFMTKLHKIDQLRHDIVLHESHLAKESSQELKELHDHSKVREAIEELETRFEKMKVSFRKFSSKND